MYLQTRSYYSLRFGTLSIEQLVALAKSNNAKALALTDINNTTGIWDFVKECRKQKLKPIAGIEFRNNNEYLYTGIALNHEGLYALNAYLSEHLLKKQDLPKHYEGNPENVAIIYPFRKQNHAPQNHYEYIGITPADLPMLVTSKLRYNQSKLLVSYPVTFSDTAGYLLHRHLRAIDKNILLSQLKYEYLTGANEIMISVDSLVKRYENYPQIVKNTEKLIAECTLEFDFKPLKNKRIFTDSQQNDRALLRRLTYEGAKYRYKTINQVVKQRIEKELKLIFDLGFAAYFLTGWDIIRYSLSQGIYHVGRGSGANSLVAYCLKITDVDPIELDLYFERFINPKRTAPPDFDIDYSWKDRDKVQEYIFSKHGKAYTALLGAMSTFQGKSILRELSKVYGLPKSETDKFVEEPRNPKNINALTKQILAIGNMMTDFPNLRSIHAGGMLISQLPINYYTALDMPPKGFQTTQWDMYVAEDIGFEKLDILSQRGIGHINECVEIVNINRNNTIDIHQVESFKKNNAVKHLLQEGETIGCFYVESPAMRGLLRKLRCNSYIGLVAASSIIRPGVAKSGMMREYIKRFHNPDGFTYLHPVMEKHLKETFGVMVYQEDVLKICHHFAGLDLADADVLRRIMSGKPRFKDEFHSIRQHFFTNCKQRGYPDTITNEVWRQIRSFAGYSFSKAHSASYAVESYQSLYLKAHYPIEFMVAVINNFGGFYRSWVYFTEAKRWDATICLPCVNQGFYKTSVTGKSVYIGFIHLKNFENKVAHAIVNERKKNGLYTDLINFTERVEITPEQLVLLIRIGAFRFTGMTKARLLWEAHATLGRQRSKPKSPTLFPAPVKRAEMPRFTQNTIADAYDEIEILEFPVSLSFFDLLQTGFRGEIMATDMLNNIGKTVNMLGLLVNLKYTWTSKKELMHFGCFFDAENYFFDTVHFPNSLKNYPFKGHGVYLLQGKVTEEFGHPGLTVNKMKKIPIQPDPRFV